MSPVNPSYLALLSSPATASDPLPGEVGGFIELLPDDTQAIWSLEMVSLSLLTGLGGKRPEDGFIYPRRLT